MSEHFAHINYTTPGEGARLGEAYLPRTINDMADGDVVYVPASFFGIKDGKVCAYSDWMLDGYSTDPPSIGGTRVGLTRVLREDPNTGTNDYFIVDITPVPPRTIGLLVEPAETGDGTVLDRQFGIFSTVEIAGIIYYDPTTLENDEPKLCYDGPAETVEAAELLSRLVVTRLGMEADEDGAYEATYDTKQQTAHKSTVPAPEDDSADVQKD